MKTPMYGNRSAESWLAEKLSPVIVGALKKSWLRRKPSQQDWRRLFSVHDAGDGYSKSEVIFGDAGLFHLMSVF